MVKPVIQSIDEISMDFKRVAKVDYTLSSLSSSFIEVQLLVDGFNQMVSEIDHNHQDLQRASLVFENTSEGIIIINDKYEIISINRAFTNITGYTEEEVIGKNPSILSSGKHDKKFFRNMWQSINKTGQWNGEIHNKKKDGEIYTELLNVNTFKDIKGNLTYYIGVFTDISAIKETENKLEYLAHHDPLTDLPNRLLCHARMSHEFQMAKRNKLQVAVLFLDLDMFKIVNDSMGHAKGDLLLQLVAQRINDSLRDEDTIARLGGDEFTIITGSLKSRQDAALVAENTLELFSTPFNIEGQEVFIGVSIGISIFPDDGENPDILLRNADAAMYRAKSEGRNNYQFYTPALTKKAAERLNIETCLRQAMDKNEFQLYYQPQWSLSSEKIVGAEALLRWKHPEMGMVDPEKFISVAEETGLIVPIGEWALKAACGQLKKWIDSGHPAIRMAVNLSARQFWKPGLDKVIGTILDESGIDPVNLEL
ncbi:MAG: diguanylate cyclase, partial [Gammaproteobacteria bacterium]|nr:diguanylate cyclase [Gammaproteobacteria bacterium]